MARIIFVIVLSLLMTLVGSTGLFAQMAHQHGEGEVAAELSYGLCPVTGQEASADYSYAYEGKAYYFCCPGCIDQFKQDPKKYISKIKEIKLEAYQYGFSPDPVAAKKGDIIKLEITSRDVAHGVYIKEYGINITVKKGEAKKAEFLADKEGKFDILCSVYCGPGHQEMKGSLIVEQ